MFEFQMDIKDAQSVNPEKLQNLGIAQVEDARYYNPKFRVEEISPKDLDEALDFINQAFYFFPLYVWIDGEKLDPQKVSNNRVEKIRLR